LPLIRAELQRRKPPLYGPLIHDLSQVLYLPFDHDDGSYARDRSGYDNHGTIYGATLATGKIGMARLFDGVDDRVVVAHDPSLNPTRITVAGWIYPLTVTGKQYGIVSKGFWGVVDKAWEVLLYYSRVRLSIYTTAEVSADSPTVSANRWSYFACTYDGSQQISYLNGVPGTPAAQSGDIATNTRDVKLGEHYWGTGDPYSFYGYIDEVRVYDRALSAAEIARLMYLRGI